MFRLPEKINNDLKEYKDLLQKFIEGEMAPARFTGIRVPWGIYSQRGGEKYMVRIRIPAGIISPVQLKALAYASREYGDENLHITTRQDIQIHNVEIEDTIKIMEYLKEYNLSPRGGGGNTIRNVTSCPLSGICGEEIFDVRGNVIALSEYLLCRDTSYTLPRKFKITFSGCDKDCSGCRLNDLGFLATYNNESRGFKVYTGGGMGASSRIGDELEEFILENDLGYCVLAVNNVFYRKGNRKDKHHNRLRFLIEQLGFEEFKRLYKKEYENLKENEYIVLRKVNLLTSNQKEIDTEIPIILDKEYKHFLEYNVSSHKEKGYSNIEIRIPQGNIDSDKIVSLANLKEDFLDIEFRTSQNQNIFICGVKNKDIYKLFLKLKEIFDYFLYPETLLDIVCCKGALTCNLGLCNSTGLAREIENKIEDSNFINKKVFKKLNIKINGCPNACGQHPVGMLAFQGMVRRVENRPLPFYKFLMGGRKDAANTRLAERIGILPAKNVPDFLIELLGEMEERIAGDIDIYKFIEVEGKDMAKKILDNYIYVPLYSENKDFYIDWGKDEEFSLAGLGAGECGAGIIDMIESDLNEAESALKDAEIKDYYIKDIKKALFLSARALLVVKGIEAKSEKEALFAFNEKFIERGIASDSYSDLAQLFTNLSDRLDIEKRKEKFNYAKNFYKHIKEIYESMDSSFNFPKKIEAAGEKPKSFLDLKGTPCPVNYVKAKLVLEGLESGSILELFLDEGEPMDNVPRSLESDGHKILKIEKLDNFYRVLVKKK